MIPNGSYCFLCFIVLVVVWFGLHFRIHVYCLECVMRMLRLGYLIDVFVSMRCRISIELPVWPTYE